MRLLMVGTGPFAVPTFLELLETHHEIEALVTAPPRPVKGKHLPPVSPMVLAAQERGLPIYAPELINSPESQTVIAGYDVDLLVVCDYGQILSAQTLARARLGGVNLHAALLPKYRGAAPINWAIYNGEKKTGVTVIHMVPQVDAGPCIAQTTIDIDPEEDAVELEKRLAVLGAWLTRRTIDAMESGRLEALPQNPALASKAPRLKKTDGGIDWTRPALAIKNQIRAMEPWPKTHTYWRANEKNSLRLILGPVRVEDTMTSASPGTIVEAAGNRLVIAAGQGVVVVQTVQPSGKRVMEVEEFLRGYRLQRGDVLGPEEPTVAKAEA